MGNTLVILLSYILNFILIILIVSLLLRIRNVEKKLITFSSAEAYSIMENMHEMVLESQRLADSLESAIKAREAVLEDLSDLVDEKILKYEKLTGEKYTVSVQKKEADKEQVHLEKVLNRKEDTKEQVSQQMQTAQRENKTDLKSKIISLDAEGRSNIDIARELGISITEVQLALRLTPKE